MASFAVPTVSSVPISSETEPVELQVQLGITTVTHSILVLVYVLPMLLKILSAVLAGSGRIPYGNMDHLLEGHLLKSIQGNQFQRDPQAH